MWICTCDREGSSSESSSLSLACLRRDGVEVALKDVVLAFARRSPPAVSLPRIVELRRCDGSG